MEILRLLILPLLAGVVLISIHTYLGIHLVERGAIFAGLFLVQLAALGTAVALLVGYDVHSVVSHAWSFGFTIPGAMLLARLRLKHEPRVASDAIVGIVWAVSAAAAILILSRAPQESEHLKEMLLGSILSVHWPALVKLAIVCSAVGVFHIVFRKRFLAITGAMHDAGGPSILDTERWDFLFYASLGLVAASSVAIAGVLLVFSYLIVPAVAAMLFTTSIAKRLAIGWSMGVFATALGVFLSVKVDLPTGAAIVCTFGIVLSLMAAARVVLRRKRG